MTRRRGLADPEVVSLLENDPELLAIADAVARTQRRGRRRARRALPALVAAALIGVILVLWAPWRGQSGLVGRAEAALGTYPVVHLVLETARGDSALVEISTGRARPETIAIELWYDEQRDLLRVRVRRNGTGVMDALETPTQAVSSAGPIERASDRSGGLEPAVVALAFDYRRALATGVARPVGEGVLAGRPVDWLELPTRFGTVDRVAVDRDTLLPLAVRAPGSGRNVSEWTVREIETLPRAAGIFSPPAEQAPTPSGGEVVASTPVTLENAATALGHQALWAGAEVADLPLGLVQSEELSRRLPSGEVARERGRGLMLLYGDRRGEAPDRDGAFVQLRQAPEVEPAYGFLGGALAVAPVPPPGFVRVERRPGSGDLWVGSLRENGLYVSISASSRDLLLAAVRSLSVIRVGDRDA